MVSKANGFLEKVERAIGSDGTYDIISREDLVSIVMLLAYGQNVFSQFGADWMGVNFRQRETTCLMVVKALLDDIPQVVFVTGRTPTDCVNIFWNRFENDRLTWTKDKYA